MRRSETRNREVFQAAAAWEGRGRFCSNKMGVSFYRLGSFISPSCEELQSELFFPGNLSRGHQLNGSGWCWVSGEQNIVA